MSYIVASKVRENISGADMQCSGDLADAVSAKVEQMLAAAVDRAKENGRKTVRPCDL